MRPATAVAVLVAGIVGYVLVLTTAGPRLLLYWALLIPWALWNYLIELWDLAIAIVAVIVLFVNVARRRRLHGRLSAPSQGAIAEEETT